MNNIVTNSYNINNNNNHGNNNNKYINIIFFSYGTRGDVQPYCIICKELVKRGYNVKIIIDSQLKYVTDSFDLDSYSLNSKIPDLKVYKDDKFIKVNSFIKDRIKQDQDNPNNLNIYYQESIGMDLIVTNQHCLPEAITVNEKLGIPFIPIFLLPIWISKNEPCIYKSNKPSSPLLNIINHKLFWKSMAKKEKVRSDKWRKKCLELKEFKKDSIINKLYNNYSNNKSNNNNNNKSKIKSIILFDKVMFLKSNKIPKDYNEKCQVYGFMISKEINFNQIPDRIVKFLGLTSPVDQNYNNGYSDNIDVLVNRPIVFGLGSMNVDDDLIIPYLKYAIKKFGKNQKWIILNNWSNYNENLELLNGYGSNNVIQFNHIDHIWLYKYCSLVITHGGIGSCASILHSAIPSIIIPLSFDQPIWSKRFKKLGISETLNLKSLKNDDDLYNRINFIKLNYHHYKFNCLKVQSKLDNNSLDKTVSYIESFINNNNNMNQII